MQNGPQINNPPSPPNAYIHMVPKPTKLYVKGCKWAVHINKYDTKSFLSYWRLGQESPDGASDSSAAYWALTKTWCTVGTGN
jgi:hypothetical protein